MDAGAEVGHEEEVRDQTVLADIERYDEPRDLDQRAVERFVDREIHHLLRGESALAQGVVGRGRWSAREARTGIPRQQFVPVEFTRGARGHLGAGFDDRRRGADRWRGDALGDGAAQRDDEQGAERDEAETFRVHDQTRKVRPSERVLR